MTARTLLRLFLVAMAAIVVVTAVMLIRNQAAGRSRVLFGTVVVVDNRPDPRAPAPIAASSAGVCRGNAAFADVTGGASIRIANDAGRTIGTAKLDNGKLARNPTRCELRFLLPKVGRSAFYTFTVASHPGAAKSRDQVIDANWDVEVRLN